MLIAVIISVIMQDSPPSPFGVISGPKHVEAAEDALMALQAAFCSKRPLLSVARRVLPGILPKHPKTT